MKKSMPRNSFRRRSKRTKTQSAKFFLEALEPRLVMHGMLADGHEVVDEPTSLDSETVEVSAFSDSDVTNDDEAGDDVQILEMSSSGGELQPAPPVTLTRFASAAELKDRLLTQAIARYESLFGTETTDYWPPIYAREYDMLMTSGGADFQTNDPSASFSNLTDTNVQVPGVDEADMVETDGNFLYIVGDSQLTIVDIRDPANLQVASRTALSNRRSHEIYLDGDRLTLVSAEWSVFAAVAKSVDSMRMVDSILPHERPEPKAQITVFDIQDRSAPKQISQIAVDGSVVSSRLANGKLMLVTQSDIGLPQPERTCVESDGDVPNDSGDEVIFEGVKRIASSSIPFMHNWPTPRKCVFETNESYVTRMSAAELDDWLPQYVIGTEDSKSISAVQNIVAIGANDSNLVSTTVIDVSAAVPGVTGSASVLGSFAAQIYATADHVYVALPRWLEGFAESTTIAQFAIGDHGSVTLASGGSVPGHVLSQFSMDEHEGSLRIAVTSGWGANANNAVYVLQPQGDSLAVVGSVEHITPGEGMQSVRFLGDEAFVVTFLRIDPVIALDLSDPTNPMVKGELIIPGFSTYLHPLGNGYLLGLGNDTNENGWTVGTQISLFDVRDLANPKLVQRESLPGQHTWSQALHDHHAVTFDASTGTLVIPVSVNDWFGNGRIGDLMPIIPMPFAFANSLPSEFGPMALLAEGEPLSISDLLSIADLLDGDRLTPEKIKSLIEHLPANAERLLKSELVQNRLKKLAEDLPDELPSLDELRRFAARLSEDVTARVKELSKLLPDKLQRFVHQILERPAARPHSGMWTFHIDPTASDPIAFVGIAGNKEGQRSVIRGDVLFTISNNWQGATVASYKLSDLGTQLDSLYVGRHAFDDWFQVDVASEGKELHVLENDHVGRQAKVVGVTAGKGSVTITRDGHSVLYQPPVDAEIGETDSFRYRVDGGEGQSEEALVSISFIGRRERGAMPDWFVVRADSETTKLDVLANDFPGITFIRAPQITAVSTPKHGSSVTIDAGAGSLSFTPAKDFVGTETFTYTVDGNQTATVTVKVVEREKDPAPIIQVRLQPTDLDGNAMRSFEIGEKFFLNVYVQDVRMDAQGVFAAYLDVDFDSSLVKVDGDIEFMGDYQNGKSFAIVSSGIDELGAFSGASTPDSAAEQLLVRVPLMAIGNGMVTIDANAPEESPAHDLLVHGSNSKVDLRRIRFGPSTLEIQSTEHNTVEPLDVNGDGVPSSPIDVLAIINELNEFGAEPVVERLKRSRGVHQEAVATARHKVFCDTNRDGYVTPIDALLVINDANLRSAAIARLESRSAMPLPPDATTPRGGQVAQEPNSESHPTVRFPIFGPSQTLNVWIAEGEAASWEPSGKRESLGELLIDESTFAASADEVFAEFGSS